MAVPNSNKPLSAEELLVKHAFRGSSYAVVRLEELTEIGNLKADAVACYRPANSQELFAVERIAVCQQKILRGERLEAGIFTTALDYCLEPDGRTFRPMCLGLVGEGDIEITHSQNCNFAAGEGMRRMVIESEVWSVMLRYQTNADRLYRRAIEDFERLKRLRPEMPNHTNVGTAPDVIDDIAILHDINPRIPLQPESSEAEPASALPVEAPNAPETGAPEDGAPLAPPAGLEPGAAATRKTHRSVSHIGAEPKTSSLKTKPLASPLRRAHNRRSVAAASARRRPACRPLANCSPPEQ